MNSKLIPLEGIPTATWITGKYRLLDAFVEPVGQYSNRLVILVDENENLSEATYAIGIVDPKQEMKGDNVRFLSIIDANNGYKKAVYYEKERG